MWSLPGALLWIPTVVNLLILVPMLELHWERYYYHGPKNTAQGEMGPFTLILLISAPMAVLLLLGWFVLFLVRLRYPRHPQEERQRGVIALAIGNVIAPLLLLFALMALA